MKVQRAAGRRSHVSRRTLRLSATLVSLVTVTFFPDSAPAATVFVANSGSNTVSVIDTGSNAVIATLPVGVSPRYVEASADGRRVYVTNQGSDTVSVIDVASRSVVATVPVGDSPLGLAASPDNLKVYVTHDSGAETEPVWVIDVSTLSASAAFSLPNQASTYPKATFHPNGSELWVSDGCGAGCTRRVSYPAHTTLGDLPYSADSLETGSAAETHISFVPGTNFLYAADSCGCCGHFDRLQHAPSIAFLGRRYEDNLGGAIWTVAAEGGIVYLARNTHCTTASIVIRKESVATDSTLATVTIPGFSGGVGAITPDGSRLYLTAQLPGGGSPSVHVVDTASMSVVATIAVGDGPHGIAVADPPADQRVFVANRGAATVSAIDAASNAVIATIPVGVNPTHVEASPDGRRVYVTNQGSDSVSVIAVATLSVIATIPVGDSPHGVAVSPDNAKVYVTHDAGQATEPVWVIDVASLTASEAFTLPNQASAVPTATFHPNGTEIWFAQGCGDGCARRVSYPGNAFLQDLPPETVGTNAGENHFSFVPGTDFLYATSGCGCCGHFDRSQYAPSIVRIGRRYEDGLGSGTWTVPAATGGIVYLARNTHCTTASIVIRKESVATDSTLATVTIPGFSGGVGAITPDGARLYLTAQLPGGGSPSVHVVDTASMTVVATIPVGDAPQGIAVADPPADALADLSVSKTDGATDAVPGQTLTYTIVAANAGPDPVTGATVLDNPPAILTSVSWTCSASAGSSCPASGGGGINASVDLLAGGTATFMLTGTVQPSATGTLSNTASIAAPGGVTDSVPGNNSATDSDTTLTPQANLSITKNDGQTTVVPGQVLTYTIGVANAGPSAATGASVSDTVPAALTAASWTCVASTGSSCPAGGSGNISHSVNLLPGGTLTYTLTGTVDVAAAAGPLANTATVATPVGTTDPTPSNNSATDTDVVVIPTLAIADVSAREGNSGNTPASFDVTLSPAAAVQVTVNHATQDVTALSGSDYTATNGMLAFAPGETTKSVLVQVIGDTLNERPESFSVTLSGASNATLFDDTGAGTIVDDEDEIVQFDADTLSDLTVFHPASGLWYMRNSTNGAVSNIGYGGTGYIPVAGDYDGDGITDVAVYHPPTGLWFIRQSTTMTTSSIGFGGTDYKPVRGDFDGDGKTDLAVFHDPTGLWFIRNSSTGTTTTIGYGASGYVTVPGDYDGDGITDLAVYHPPSGLWFVRNSSTTTTTTTGFGGSAYAPVRGDYDGDGKTDLAVFHAATGLWYIRYSATSTVQAIGYGGSGYTPVPGKHDADGKTDLALYHEASGLWFLRSSLGGGSSTSIGFGGTGYSPVS